MSDFKLSAKKYDKYVDRLQITHYIPEDQKGIHTVEANCVCRPLYDPNVEIRGYMHRDLPLPPSRIDIIGQNGNDGDHYPTKQETFQKGNKINTGIDDVTRESLRILSDTLEKNSFPNDGHAEDRYVGGSHYENMEIEPVDVVDTWPHDQQVGAYRFGCLKHTMRLGTKDERLQEAKKLKWYAGKLVEVLENGNA